MKEMENISVGYVLESGPECLTVLKVTGVAREGTVLKNGEVPRRYRFGPEYVFGHYYGSWLGQGRLYRPNLEELEGASKDLSGAFVCFPNGSLQAYESSCLFSLHYPAPERFELAYNVWYPVLIRMGDANIAAGVYQVNCPDGTGKLRYVCYGDFKDRVDRVELYLRGKKVGEACIETSHPGRRAAL